MFNFGKQENVTIISKGTRFDGSIESDNAVFVEGALTTSTLNANSVQVAEGGVLELDTLLTCAFLEVSGTIRGNINVGSLKVNKGAHIKGDISYSTIECKGGVIEGTLKYITTPL